MHFSSQSQLHVCLCGLYLLWSKNHHELILPTSSLYIQTLIDHWVMPWITCTFITVNIHLSCYHKYSLEGQMCVNAQVKILPEIEDSEPERCEWPTIQESQTKEKNQIQSLYEKVKGYLFLSYYMLSLVLRVFDPQQQLRTMNWFRIRTCPLRSRKSSTRSFIWYIKCHFCPLVLTPRNGISTLFKVIIQLFYNISDNILLIYIVGFGL